MSKFSKNLITIVPQMINRSLAKTLIRNFRKKCFLIFYAVFKFQFSSFTGSITIFVCDLALYLN
ncbi:hypothetical protein BpHYR1_042609 [Brachionus plicatilis]|uniref:Uncharacterized protein n=1 Tax=Brachionus plicatilis TaxID=10195 RepID=A0A3M7PYB7_BRAPC|nr:hypothetical protein BpHYR1_042609 [Brachionus plicatilis]